MTYRDSSRLPLALCAACAIAIAGCGGGDDSTSAGPTEGFVAQADAICVGVASQSAALAQPTDEMRSLAKYMASGVAIIKPALEKFNALTPPPDMRGDFQAYLAAIENQLHVEQRIHDAATEGDEPAVEALLKELKAEDTVQKATALGLTECAKGA